MIPAQEIFSKKLILKSSRVKKRQTRAQNAPKEDAFKS